MQPIEQLRARTEQARQKLMGNPLIADVANGRYDLDSYLDFLHNAFHHVKHTVPLLMASGARLPSDLEWLRNAFRRYIDEEYGHERWILDDISACGGSSEAARTSGPSHEVETMVAYVRDYVAHVHPVGVLGMVNVLEGTSVALATATADLVQTHLGLPDDAFTYLRSHGELDQDHVTFFEDIVNRLTPSQLDHVIHVSLRMYRLYGDVLASVSTAFEARRDAA